MQPEWLSEWEKSSNLSTHKNHATSPNLKSCNLSTKNNATYLFTQKITRPLNNKKIMQPLHKKNHAISPQTNYTISSQKNHATSIQKSRNIHKNKSCNLCEWVSDKNHATSLHKKVMQHLHKISRNLSQKKSWNLSTQKNHVTTP